MPGLDMFGLPDGSDRQQWIPYTGGIAVPWNKPRGITMCHFLLLNGGGGGGGGFSGATSTNRFGGGGGSAGISGSLIIPASFLPDRLWILSGAPGPGGAAGIAGSPGGSSGVMLDNAISIPNTDQCIVSLNSSSNGGQAGTASAAGAGGGGISGTTIASGGSIYCYAGVSVFGPAMAGTNSTLNYSSITSITTGGSAGGEANSSNTDNAGGQFSPGANVPVSLSGQGVSGGLAGGGIGVNGSFQRQPLLFLGGTGGGSNAAGTGGAGGNGSFGCGGGGGGGGITGGAGGNGGPGLVIITCW